MRISEFIERSNEAATPEEVFELFRKALEDHGYDHVVFAPVTVPAQHALARGGSVPSFTRKPSSLQWFEQYMANRYMDIDPVLLLAPTRRTPFSWDEVENLQHLSPRQRQIMRESRDAGLKSGLSIPIHGPQGEGYVVSLASDVDGVDPTPHLRALQVLAVQFQLATSQVQAEAEQPPPAFHLTERERECLTWTARGKSAWAISRILNVSEHTINFHLKSAMKKLGTANRVAAVVLSIRTGLIMP